MTKMYTLNLTLSEAQPLAIFKIVFSLNSDLVLRIKSSVISNLSTSLERSVTVTLRKLVFV